jgi:hypothetical protein
MNLDHVLEGFDYQVDCDDFLLYELGRLIDDDRASLDDEEFRELIDEGIHEHVEIRLELRAEIALRLRVAMPGIDNAEQPAALRVLRAVEDTGFPLRDAGIVLKTYTRYLIQRIQECATRAISRESEVADALFECLDDRTAVEAALNTLGSIPSAVSARILAHLVSEPMLDEDLEMKAYRLVLAMWPLPRHYILFSLKTHSHEDIPYRWFQLLIESNEPTAVDKIMEELRAHADDPTYKEDLVALMELLAQSSDPGLEDKIMQMLNDAQTSPAASQMLEQFLKESPRRTPSNDRSAWDRASRLESANKKYQAAARLFDSGRRGDAVLKLDEILKEIPDYPFARMLKNLI